MKRNFKILFVGLALAVIMPSVFAAKPVMRQRPFNDFLKTQGVTTQYFAHPDISGWVDGGVITFALVDYPGVIAKWLKTEYGVNLQTKVCGSIWEEELPDGTARVTVKLKTSNALGFAQSTADLAASNFDWEGTDEIFGQKASDVGQGEEPALGWVCMELCIIIPEPGAPLPDLIDAVNDPEGFGLLKFSIAAFVCGMDAEGDSALLMVVQVAVWDEDNNALVWPVEIVEVTKLGM